uniref:YEATS domain-containing protein n=1 Tax=Monodon monoceros TaxID=40151 RepID=A0A8C6AVC5_MONMO
MFKRMAESGPDSGGGVKGVTTVKPIIYGNVARYFGKKREEDGHTHQWTVYVKPYRNEDMSAYVKKIQFKLHESYGNPLRVVTKPPYEITEHNKCSLQMIKKKKKRTSKRKYPEISEMKPQWLETGNAKKKFHPNHNNKMYYYWLINKTV